MSFIGTARDVYIVEAVRTPIAKGKENGALHPIHPVHLLAHVLKETVTRARIPASNIDDVIIGCVTPIREQGANIARLGALQAGFPVSVPGVQLNRMCGSGQQSIHFAAQAIASGDMEIAIGGGVEMMGTVKMGSDASDDIFTGKASPFTDNFPHKLVHQGVSAELVAEKYGITRAECDAFAVESHRRADKAIKSGYFKSQITPVPVKDTIFAQDEGIRWPTEISTLTKLPSIFKKNGGCVTAGNASQISDGAAAVLLASGAKADALGLRKRARFVARVVTGSDPTVMLDGVIPATQMALKKAGLRVEDIDVFEINEAFASVVLAWQKVIKPDPARVNPNGGAIAHGHPLGATGAALMTKLLNELERTGGRYGLQTMCIGHGMATATIIERLDSKINAKL